MGPLASVVIFILVVSFGVFVTFFGRIPALRYDAHFPAVFAFWAMFSLT